jgi:hypothetical protein
METAVNGTAEAWRERIAAQRASGMSIRAWCRTNSQLEHAFYSWRSRLGLSPQSGSRRRRRRVDPPGFAQVMVDRLVTKSPAVGTSFAEPIFLRLGGGRELVLPVSMADERVALLIRLIESRS